MLRISEFFGIIIYMYFMDTQKHDMPHFHARYSGQEATFTLERDLISGRLSIRTEKLVKEWAVERQIELKYAWSQAFIGKEIPWIAPIK